MEIRTNTRSVGHSLQYQMTLKAEKAVNISFYFLNRKGI